MTGGKGPAENQRDVAAGAATTNFETNGDLSLRLVPVVDGRTLPTDPLIRWRRICRRTYR